MATGQPALTLYVANVLAGMGVLEMIGRIENQTLPFALLSSAIFRGVAMLFASLWRRKFGRGPIEGVMRILVDSKMNFLQNETF